jgi:hypothetical protein
MTSVFIRKQPYQDIKRMTGEDRGRLECWICKATNVKNRGSSPELGKKHGIDPSLSPQKESYLMTPGFGAAPLL